MQRRTSTKVSRNIFSLEKCRSSLLLDASSHAGNEAISLDAAFRLLDVMGKSGLKAWWNNAPAECKSAGYVEKLMALYEVFGESEFKRLIHMG